MERGGSAGRVYEPVYDIARGGMGRVELVVRREGSFARVLAMKRLLSELEDDFEVRDGLLEEARIAGLIRHPNVVAVLDVGKDELGAFLVMEYVEGVPASKLIVDAREHGRRLGVALAVEVARQGALGLAAAHELVGAGGRIVAAVHSDVSPQNLLVGFDGLVRVADFGIASAFDRRAAMSTTGFRGKIGYVSPEQVRGEPLDARTDIFSLGVVLYELLTCTRPFGGTRSQAFAAVLSDEVPDVREARSDAPAELATLLGAMLEKERARRPSSAREVAGALDRIGVVLRAAGPVPSLEEHLASRFAKEREEQRAAIATALERTRADGTMLPGETTAATRAERVGVTETTTTTGALAAHIATTSQARPAPASPPSAPPTLREPGRARPGAGMIVAVAGAILVVIVAAWWLGARGTKPDEAPRAAAASRERAEPAPRPPPAAPADVARAPSEAEPASRAPTAARRRASRRARSARSAPAPSRQSGLRARVMDWEEGAP